MWVVDYGTAGEVGDAATLHYLLLCFQGSVGVDTSDPRIWGVDTLVGRPRYCVDAEPTDLEIKYVNISKLREYCRQKDGEMYWDVWDRVACLTPAERVVWDRLKAWDRAVEETFSQFSWD